MHWFPVALGLTVSLATLGATEHVDAAKRGETEQEVGKEPLMLTC